MIIFKFKILVADCHAKVGALVFSLKVCDKVGWRVYSHAFGEGQGGMVLSAPILDNICGSSGGVGGGCSDGYVVGVES